MANHLHGHIVYACGCTLSRCECSSTLQVPLHVRCSRHGGPESLNKVIPQIVAEFDRERLIQLQED